MKYDAILVLGGGLQIDGSPSQWVQERLQIARDLEFETNYIITSSRGTLYKPAVIDSNLGHEITEAEAGARWLINHGVEEQKIMLEPMSYDTLGNAFFLRLTHCDPRKFKKLLIITSNFHMERTKQVFDWVFSLNSYGYSLEYKDAPNVGLDLESLNARLTKEKEGILNMNKLMKQISNYESLHNYIFTKHLAYTPFPRVFSHNVDIRSY